MNPGSKEAVFRTRILEVLASMALQFPSLSVRIDLWRPAIVNRGEYADQQVEVWIRLDEEVPAFYVETMERWFEKEIGIIRENVNYVILPAGFDLEPDDHVILNGESWMVIQSAEQAGISKVKIDIRKSRFVAPARTEPTYRQMTMKARIS